ncbi:XrtA system polysaccharide chain length determinant [Flocculibacter collagenilyticus]|uniref:XrtA system polysaccharide chain length determinant n=1 Tax=Flocculibacter collagenilyticus TaxID=2744479 RepID=UPI0018F2E80E|nr:XrtA system polysaccharide chain length determinant [Flocculibacter collagenilyticus]
MQELNQTIELILNYLKGIWIKKRYIIIASWLICPIGWAYVVSLPDTYSSSAKVYADTRNMLQPLLRGLTLSSNPDQEVLHIAKTLFSWDNLEDIAREVDLDVRANNQTEFEKIVDELKSNLTLSSTARENIFTISYKGESPELAQKIVQTTLDKFVESTLGKNREDSDVAEAFLDQQIKEYETRLYEAEQRLADFKRKQSKIIPESSNYYELLKEEKKKLANATLILRELESRYESAQAQLLGEEPVFGLSPETTGPSRASITTQFDARISALESKLDELLIRYTDQHPEVQETQKLLVRLKKSRKDELAEIAKSMAESDGTSSYMYDDLNANPVYQEMKITVANLRSEMASIKVRVEAFQKNVTELEDKINLVPSMEAEQTALNRDYGITRDKYQELLQRKESARLSREAANSTDDVTFRVIDPPKLPKEPSGPMRGLLYTVVLVAGFAVGIAIAFIMSQLKPVVLRASQLKQITGLPVFGVVSHTDGDLIKHQMRRKLITFAVSCSAIVFIYATLMAFEFIFGGMPTHLIARFL